MFELTDNTRATLRTAMADAFDIAGLELVCRDLGIDPEEIPGRDKAKTNWIAEVIKFVEVRQRIEELIVKLIETRPEQQWLKIISAEIQVAGDDAPIDQTSQTFAPTFRLRPAKPGSLRMLAEQNSEVHDLMTACNRDLAITYEHIQRLSNYKDLHELFQQLDDTYQVIAQAAKRVALDETAWDDMSAQEPDVQTVCGRIIAIASVEGSSAPLWVKRLTNASIDLASAVRSSNLDLLRKTTETFDGIVGQQLGTLNVQLVQAAKDVGLKRLIELLMSVRDKMSTIKLAATAFAQDLQAFNRGVDNLRSHTTALESLTRQHDEFQQADDELRRIQGQLKDDIGELERAWSDLQPLLISLCEGQTEKWATELMQYATELDAALAGTVKNPRTVRNAFARYRAKTTQRFNQLDIDLVKQCRTLRQIDGPFADVWRLVA